MLVFVSFLGQGMLGIGVMPWAQHMGIIKGAELEGFLLLSFNASLLEFIKSVATEYGGQRVVLGVLLITSRRVTGFVHVV